MYLIVDEVVIATVFFFLELVRLKSSRLCYKMLSLHI
jgi:hypothetical protein